MLFKNTSTEEALGGIPKTFLPSWFSDSHVRCISNFLTPSPSTSAMFKYISFTALQRWHKTSRPCSYASNPRETGVYDGKLRVYDPKDLKNSLSFPANSNSMVFLAVMVWSESFFYKLDFLHTCTWLAQLWVLKKLETWSAVKFWE